MTENIITDLENVRYHLISSKHKQVIDDAIDLINRLQAENDGLYESLDYRAEKIRELEDELKTSKAEAIKEFAERLKAETIDVDVSYGYGREHYTEAVAVIVIDNLVKEMVGDTE